MYIAYKNCGILSFPPLPSHCSNLNSHNIGRIMSELKVPMLREIKNFDIKEETDFYYIIKDQVDTLDNLKPKVRNLVRKALKKTDIRKVTYHEIVEKGYEVYLSAFQSYKDHTLFQLPSFEQFSNSIITHKERDYWAVYDNQDGKLIAYAVNVCYPNGTIEYGSLKCIPVYLKSHVPYYGLIHIMNEYYLTDGKWKYVTDGARTLTEHSNIQEFLCQKFNFRKAYCNMTMHYVWWLKISINILYPFRNLISHKIIKLVMKQESWSRRS